MEDNKSLAPVMNLEQLVRLGMESEQAQGVALRAVQLGVSTMALGLRCRRCIVWLRRACL